MSRSRSKRPIFLAGLLFLGAAMGLWPHGDADARAKPGIIRDAEIENIIRSFSLPVFQAAGLDPEAVSVLIINDSVLNAFVSGGQNIFITTGLLMRSEDPSQVIGVIAHETGHIAGGHLARFQEQLRGAQMEAIIAMILGAGAAASGQAPPGAGAAVILGGQQVAERSLLQYTRTQESAADQAAMTYLDQTKQSSGGMAEFLRILHGEESATASPASPYLRTHPLTVERISAVDAHLTRSPYSKIPPDPQQVEAHARMRAKLTGFIKPLTYTLREYPESDTSVAARYARAIGYYRKPDLAHALPLIDGLIAEEPENPYFHELKGQMLFENGRALESIAPYQKAANLMPQNALLLAELGQAQVETNAPEINKEAIKNLAASARLEKDNARTWQLLGTAYGRAGQVGLASLSLAEYSLLAGRKKDARFQAERAEKNLKTGSPAWLRAQDILQSAIDDEENAR